MSKCPSCHYENKPEVRFCVSCGTTMEQNNGTNPQGNNQRLKKKPTSNKKMYLIVSVIVILGIALFTSYQLLAKKYSPEVVTEQFRTALVKEDRDSLKALIRPDDERIDVNDESLDALFDLIAGEPSIVQEIMDDLKSNYAGGLFYLKKDGKQLGIFDQYTIGTRGYFLVLSDSVEGDTTFYLNDNKIGKLKETESYREFGPYLAGSYFVKAVSGPKGKQGEDIATVKLVGTDTKIEADFDTEVVEIEEDYMIEVREAANTSSGKNHYIIPESDSVYLDREDLYHLSSSELRIARNEVFARHGYVFDSKELQNYFNQMDWYSPNSYYTGALTSVEEYNVELMKSLE